MCYLNISSILGGILGTFGIFLMNKTLNPDRSGPKVDSFDFLAGKLCISVSILLFRKI